MNQPEKTVRSGLATWRVLGIVCVVGILLCLALIRVFRPPESAESLVSRARELQQRRDVAGAEKLARRALEIDPDLYLAHLLVADCAAAQGRFADAVQQLSQVTDQEPDIQISAHFLTAVLNHDHLRHFSAAEAGYRQVLELDPDHVDANTRLAKLLLTCARRTEAVPLILQLIRLEAPDDLLIALAKQGTVVYEEGLLEAAHSAAPDDPNPLVGLAWHAAEEGQTAAAIDYLQEALKCQPDFIPARAALGEQLANAEQYDQLLEWHKTLPAACDQFPQTWLARARLAEHVGDTGEAIYRYARASQLVPEMKMPNTQLARLLSQQGDNAAAKVFADRLLRLEALENKQNQFMYELEFILELIMAYAAAGRLWEAYGWSQTADDLDEPGGRLENMYAELRQRIAELLLTVTIPEQNAALNMDLDKYREGAAEGASPVRSRPAARTGQPAAAYQLLDHTASAGLNFTYFNGVAGQTKHRIYEFTGGGIGVLDMDRDGYPDLCLTQGQTWPPNTENGHHDAIFRNRGGTRYEEVSLSAGIIETGFGQGASIGDVNSDGFPDVYVANLGRNALWINNGDGTFTDASRSAGIDGAAVWTTSCAIADFSGDGLADLYEVNYVRGTDLLDRVCQLDDGSPRQCLPFEFSAETDRLLINAGDGTFRDETSTVLSKAPVGKGLGIAVWSADHSGALSLYIANDTTPNFLFSPSQSSQGTRRLEEQGILGGVAFNAQGKAEGSMGIALNDFDLNGQLDLFVTNFYQESNTLYLCQAPGVYEDSTRRAGLVELSMEDLGFGTVSLDLDWDNTPELFVANGHTDDLTRVGKPYRMSPQLLHWTGDRFVDATTPQLGDYFQQKWLGRAVTKLDWNLDGREDLVIGHLQDQTKLLTNQTVTEGGSVTLRLIGVDCERDAIGTSVRVTMHGTTHTFQLTAGDGYQSSHERVIRFATGDATTIEQLDIHWPGGTLQTFQNLPCRNQILVQGSAPLLAL